MELLATAATTFLLVSASYRTCVAARFNYRYVWLWTLGV
jgi:hypothetical protein